MQSNGGCQTCRSRRIKCDGRKPICLRCIKSQRPCVEADAAKQELFAIHLENHYASGIEKRPRGPRSNLIPLRPNFDLRTRAHAYYLQNHFHVVPDVPDFASTWTECLREWQAAGKASPIVDLAFSTLALSVFARNQKCLQAETEASRSYDRLLREMQNRVLKAKSGDIDADEIDAYLLTAYFMARYESALQQNKDPMQPAEPTKVWSHFDGAAAILKLWYDSRCHYTSTIVVKLTRRSLIKISLLREQRLPRWLADGSQFGEQGIALEFDIFTVRVINAYHSYLSIKHESAHGQTKVSKIDQLISEAHTLDQEIQTWSSQFPSKWSYRKDNAPETYHLPNDEFYSSIVFSCARLGYTAAWNEYLAIRMLAINTCVRIHILAVRLWPNIARGSELRKCLSELNTSAESLASLVPFCLDRVRIRGPPSPSSEASTPIVEISSEPLKPYLVNLVVWPMSIAASVQEMDPALGQWFRSNLYRMGSTTSECLIAYAMSDYWTIL